MGETDQSKTPNFMVLVQEQLDLLILSSVHFYISDNERTWLFPHDTLACKDECLTTPNHFSEDRSRDFNYIHWDRQRPSPVLFSLPTITSSIKHQMSVRIMSLL